MTNPNFNIQFGFHEKSTILHFLRAKKSRESRLKKILPETGKEKAPWRRGRGLCKPQGSFRSMTTRFALSITISRAIFYFLMAIKRKLLVLYVILQCHAFETVALHSLLGGKSTRFLSRKCLFCILGLFKI